MQVNLRGKTTLIHAVPHEVLMSSGNSRMDSDEASSSMRAIRFTREPIHK